MFITSQRVTVLRRAAMAITALTLSLTALVGVGPQPVELSAPAAAAATYDSNGPEGTVYRLYRAYFLREPDRGGFDYWVNAYRSGYPLNKISNDFARSEEFRGRYGSLDNRQFLDRVYANVLGRQPDQGGYSYWLDQMNRGMLRGYVMIYFSDSAEFRSKTAGGVPPGYTAISQYESDQRTIKRLWRGQSDAFSVSTQHGFSFMAANNYPGLGGSAEECRTFDDGYRAPDGYWQEIVVHDGTAERDDDWRMPDGPTAGQPLQGRVYILTVTFTEGEPGYAPLTYVMELHTTVLPDGSAKFFVACWE